MHRHTAVIQDGEYSEEIWHHHSEYGKPVDLRRPAPRKHGQFSSKPLRSECHNKQFDNMTRCSSDIDKYGRHPELPRHGYHSQEEKTRCRQLSTGHRLDNAGHKCDLTHIKRDSHLSSERKFDIDGDFNSPPSATSQDSTGDRAGDRNQYHALHPSQDIHVKSKQHTSKQKLSARSSHDKKPMQGNADAEKSNCVGGKLTMSGNRPVDCDTRVMGQMSRDPAIGYRTSSPKQIPLSPIPVRHTSSVFPESPVSPSPRYAKAHHRVSPGSHTTHCLIPEAGHRVSPGSHTTHCLIPGKSVIVAKQHKPHHETQGHLDTEVKLRRESISSAGSCSTCSSGSSCSTCSGSSDSSSAEDSDAQNGGRSARLIHRRKSAQCQGDDFTEEVLTTRRSKAQRTHSRGSSDHTRRRNSSTHYRYDSESEYGDSVMYDMEFTDYDILMENIRTPDPDEMMSDTDDEVEDNKARHWLEADRCEEGSIKSTPSKHEFPSKSMASYLTTSPRNPICLEHCDVTSRSANIGRPSNNISPSRSQSLEKLCMAPVESTVTVRSTGPSKPSNWYTMPSKSSNQDTHPSKSPYGHRHTDPSKYLPSNQHTTPPKSSSSSRHATSSNSVASSNHTESSKFSNQHASSSTPSRGYTTSLKIASSSHHKDCSKSPNQYTMPSKSASPSQHRDPMKSRCCEAALKSPCSKQHGEPSTFAFLNRPADLSSAAPSNQHITPTISASARQRRNPLKNSSPYLHADHLKSSSLKSAPSKYDLDSYKSPSLDQHSATSKSHDTDHLKHRSYSSKSTSSEGDKVPSKSLYSDHNMAPLKNGTDGSKATLPEGVKASSKSPYSDHNMVPLKNRSDGSISTSQEGVKASSKSLYSDHNMALLKNRTESLKSTSPEGVKASSKSPYSDHNTALLINRSDASTCSKSTSSVGGKATSKFNTSDRLANLSKSTSQNQNMSSLKCTTSHQAANSTTHISSWQNNVRSESSSSDHHTTPARPSQSYQLATSTDSQPEDVFETPEDQQSMNSDLDYMYDDMLQADAQPEHDSSSDSVSSSDLMYDVEKTPSSIHVLTPEHCFQDNDSRLPSKNAESPKVCLEVHRCKSGEITPGMKYTALPNNHTKEERNKTYPKHHHIHPNHDSTESDQKMYFPVGRSTKQTQSAHSTDITMPTCRPSDPRPHMSSPSCNDALSLHTTKDYERNEEINLKNTVDSDSSTPAESDTDSEHVGRRDSTADPVAMTDVHPVTSNVGSHGNEFSYDHFLHIFPEDSMIAEMSELERILAPGTESQAAINDEEKTVLSEETEHANQVRMPAFRPVHLHSDEANVPFEKQTGHDNTMSLSPDTGTESIQRTPSKDADHHLELCDADHVNRCLMIENQLPDLESQEATTISNNDTVNVSENTLNIHVPPDLGSTPKQTPEKRAPIRIKMNAKKLNRDMLLNPHPASSTEINMDGEVLPTPSSGMSTLMSTYREAVQNTLDMGDDETPLVHTTPAQPDPLGMDMMLNHLMVQDEHIRNMEEVALISSKDDRSRSKRRSGGDRRFDRDRSRSRSWTRGRHRWNRRSRSRERASRRSRSRNRLRSKSRRRRRSRSRSRRRRRSRSKSHGRQPRRSRSNQRSSSNTREEKPSAVLPKVDPSHSPLQTHDISVHAEQPTTAPAEAAPIIASEQLPPQEEQSLPHTGTHHQIENNQVGMNEIRQNSAPSKTSDSKDPLVEPVQDVSPVNTDMLAAVLDEGMEYEEYKRNFLKAQGSNQHADCGEAGDEMISKNVAQCDQSPQPDLVVADRSSTPVDPVTSQAIPVQSTDINVTNPPEPSIHSDPEIRLNVEPTAVATATYQSESQHTIRSVDEQLEQQTSTHGQRSGSPTSVVQVIPQDDPYRAREPVVPPKSPKHISPVKTCLTCRLHSVDPDEYDQCDIHAPYDDLGNPTNQTNPSHPPEKPSNNDDPQQYELQKSHNDPANVGVCPADEFSVKVQMEDQLCDGHKVDNNSNLCDAASKYGQNIHVSNVGESQDTVKLTELVANPVHSEHYNGLVSESSAAGYATSRELIQNYQYDGSVSHTDPNQQASFESSQRHELRPDSPHRQSDSHRRSRKHHSYSRSRSRSRSHSRHDSRRSYKDRERRDHSERKSKHYRHGDQSYQHTDQVREYHGQASMYQQQLPYNYQTGHAVNNSAQTSDPNGQQSIQTFWTARARWPERRPRYEDIDPAVYQMSSIVGTEPAEAAPLTEQEQGRMLIQQHSLEGPSWTFPTASNDLCPPGVEPGTVTSFSAPMPKCSIAYDHHHVLHGVNQSLGPDGRVISQYRQDLAARNRQSRDRDGKSRNDRAHWRSSNDRGTYRPRFDHHRRSRSNERSRRSRSKGRSRQSRGKYGSRRSRSKERSRRSRSKDRSRRSRSRDGSSRSRSKERSKRSRSIDRSRRTRSKERSKQSRSKERSRRSRSNDKSRRSRYNGRLRRSRSKAKSREARSRDRAGRSESQDRTSMPGDHCVVEDQPQASTSANPSTTNADSMSHNQGESDGNDTENDSDLHKLKDGVSITSIPGGNGPMISPHRRSSSSSRAGIVDSLPAGYCFVEFPDAEEGRKAMLRLSGKVIPGSKPPKLFKLNHASFGREHLRNRATVGSSQEYSLFIGDLSEDVDDLMLYSTFQRKYKSVKAAKVVIDQAGHSRGYGFVRFGEEEEQKAALVEMQKYVGLGRNPIKVSIATPKKRGNYSSSSSYMSQGYYNQQRQSYNNQSYYPNSWWQSYQSPAGQYYGYPGAGAVADYSTDYQGAAQSQTQEEPEEDLEDPELEIDVTKENDIFMERSEEFYVALEASRWHPLDNVMSPISTAST